MRPQTSSAAEPVTDRESDSSVWGVVLAASRLADRLAETNQYTAFAFTREAELRPVPIEDRAAVIAWRPGSGWEPLLSPDDPDHALIDLYLPICRGTARSPVTVGHLGQSLDGFIATHAGESRWVTGHENIVHLHRLRALCDAVVVGAGTVAADDPQLTTRLVSGPNPLRVIIDPGRRLGDHHRVFRDDSAETLYVCARSSTGPDERSFGLASIVAVEDGPGGIDVGELLRLLHARGCARVFVEGGGVTVSMFLEANLLDRLHVAIAPLLIGDGRPAIRLPAPAVLGDCQRPPYRVFRMGHDVLFDCDLASNGNGSPEGPNSPPPSIARII